MTKLLTILVLCVVVGPAQLAAQVPDLPFERIPLADLSAFEPTTSNWQIAGGATADRTVELDIATQPGQGVLANVPSEGQDGPLFSRFEHGDLELDVDVMMPSGSNSGLYFQGRYEVQLFDSWGKPTVEHSDLGGIYERWDESRPEGEQGYEGHAPAVNVSRAPGLWQHLQVLFIAPRFDDSGRKVENARFEWVRLNGVVIQENVEVTGPTRAAAFEDEVPEGPLMIQGDHGPVAFRNMRYRAYEAHRIELSDLTYRYYRGDFVEDPRIEELELNGEGPAEGLTVTLADAPKRYALVFDGTMDVPVTGTYAFELLATGEGRLSIDGRNVVDSETRATGRPGRTPVRSATTTLTAGAHPFQLLYAKGAWNDDYPALGLMVSGPGMARQELTEADSYSETAYDQYQVDVGDEPVVFRGFIEHDGRKRTHAAAVGDPTGLHYAIDMQQGALLAIWKGDFVDATSMWHMRGEPQVATPLGSALSLSGSPSFGSPADGSASWPDSLAGLTFKGYHMGPDRRPVFTYSYGGGTIEDRIVPDEQGRYLTRTLTVQGGPANLWVLAARGETIEDLGEGRYSVGQSYYIELPAGLEGAQLRETPFGDEVVIPVPQDGATSTVTYDIVW